MKFVHMADLHLDAQFTNLTRENHLGELRRLEQREALKNVIQYCKENEIELLFISGDLYEQNYIRKTTIEYINKLFAEIPNTKIFIAPGNHDPYIKNSFYYNYSWNENVKIFKGEIEKYSYKNCNIYGYGFTDFYLERNNQTEIKIDENDKINILITHGELNASDLSEKNYNPLSEKQLEKSNFDYIALGHIHKPYYKEKELQKIVYPGSLISLGFDEQGEHGMIVGEAEKDKFKIKFIPIDKRSFKEILIDISEIYSKEELIEKINEIDIDINEFVEIVLIGKRHFEINKNEIYKLINNKNILKIKNETKINYNLEEIAKENNLKGIFVRRMLKKCEENEKAKEEIEKAIEIGLDAILSK